MTSVFSSKMWEIGSVDIWQIRVVAQLVRALHLVTVKPPPIIKKRLCKRLVTTLRFDSLVHNDAEVGGSSPLYPTKVGIYPSGKEHKSSLP